MAKHFVCGRGGGEYGKANSPVYVDLSCIHSLGVDQISAYEMIGLIEMLAMSEKWLVLVFHNIDGPNINIASDELRTLFEYLTRRSDEIWVAPVNEVALKIKQARDRAS